MPVYLVIDNGSKKPEATLRLREVAAKLSAVAGKTVHAVSLQHADAIEPHQLNNIPANTFYSFLQQQLKQGHREFVVLPLFFGMSRALSSFIPEQVSLLEKEFGPFTVKLADVIFPLPGGEERLAKILHDHIKVMMSHDNVNHQKLVLVDHGSPAPKITEVRKQLAIKLSTLLGDNVVVDQACMEKRAGPEYDFNGDLLEDYLKKQAEKGNNNIIIAMLFFLPGRHAGECGDIQEICDNVASDYPELQIRITPLINEHELLISILHDRLLAAES